MASYYPPTNFFQNINFNNDFYAIPNNNQGISLAYANTHYLFSTGVATSTAITTFFSGSIGIGTVGGTAGTLNALSINAINSLQINGNDILNIISNNLTPYDKIVDRQNAITALSNALQNNINTTNNNLTNTNNNLTSTNNNITNNYYSKISIDNLLSSKQNNLTFQSPLSNTANLITIDLSSYDKIIDRENAITNLANTYVSSNVLTGYLAPYDKITDRQTAINTVNNSIGSINNTLNTCLKTTDIQSGDIGLFTSIGGSFLNIIFNSTHFKDVAVVGLVNRQFNLTDVYANLPSSKNNKINWNSPLNYNSSTDTASIDLSAYSTTAINDGKYLKLDGTNTMALNSSITLTGTGKFSGDGSLLTNLPLNAYSTTSINDTKYLKLDGTNSMTGAISGITTITANTANIKTITTVNNTSIGTPTKDILGGTGDKLILSSGVLNTNVPYSLGIDTSTLWISSPSNIKFYNNSIQTLNMATDGTLTIAGKTIFSNSSINFNYNIPGTYFTDNGFTSYFTLNANVTTNFGLQVSPFITCYNRMFKNGVNTAMDIKTFGGANSGVNSDILIRLDSGGDPTPGSNAGTITFNIDGSNRHIINRSSIGIGTTVPGSYALNVNGTSYLNGATTINGILQIGNAGRLKIGSGTTDYSLIGTLDTDGALNTKIIISGNTRTSFSGNIDYYATSTGNHLFYTTDTNIERMRINSLGNVGIGTNNPRTLLHIKGTNPALTIMGQGNTGATSQLNLSTYDTTTNAPNCSLIATDTGSFGATFQIKQKTAGADANSQFTSLFIDNSGNVNIGTTGQNYKLYVNGSTYINGATTVNGNLNIQNTYALDVSGGAGDGKIYRPDGNLWIEFDDILNFKSTYANNMIVFNQGSVTIPNILVVSTQIRSPKLTATLNSVSYASNIYGSGQNGWYIYLNTYWSGNDGNDGMAYLTLSMCFSQNTSIKWFGRIMVNRGGGAFNIITDYRSPSSGGTEINVSDAWGSGGQNFLFISQTIMNTSYTLLYKIIG